MRLPLLTALPVFATVAVLPSSLLAQQSQAPPVPTVAASSFATAEVRLGGHYVGTQWVPRTSALEGPSRITITYGQPHMRGRTIVGGLVPFDTVWRLGANLATILRTDVDLTVGGKFLTPGAYSLYALPTKSGWQLIINRQVGQWGTEYDASQDVARIPLRSRRLGEPFESLTIYLIPEIEPKGAPSTMPHGTLKIVWEKTELATDWKVGR